MKANTEPINGDTFYHVYNRGINGESIFKEARNYQYFLNLYHKYISPVADTYAYCLLNNHFHMLVRTRAAEEILTVLGKNKKDKQKSLSFYISNQFAKFFNSYAQAINKSSGRTGGLFETPFRRIEVNEDSYFSELVWYIHCNPQKHGLVSDFKNYPYSSYKSHLSEKPTKLMREDVISWFGDKEGCIKFHERNIDVTNINKVFLEDV